MKTFVTRAICAAVLTTSIAGAYSTTAHAEPNLDRIVSANPENFTPNVNEGKVEGLVQIGGRIIAVGKFTTVTPSTGTTVTRHSIFAYNATTGVIDTTFVPNVGTKEVTEVVDAGDGTVFIGGQDRECERRPRPQGGADQRDHRSGRHDVQGRLPPTGLSGTCS